MDGAEGGTGAAPPEFSNSVGMPLVEGLTFVDNVLIGAGVRNEVKVFLLPLPPLSLPQPPFLTLSLHRRRRAQRSQGAAARLALVIARYVARSLAPPLTFIVLYALLTRI